MFTLHTQPTRHSDQAAGFVGRLVRDVRQRYVETGSVIGTAAYAAGRMTLGLPRHLARGRRRARARVAVDGLRDIRERSDGRPLLAIRVTGGLGDYIVCARFLRDMALAVEPFQFDIYANNAAIGAWVFADLAGFERTLPESLFDHVAPDYDASISLNQMVVVHTDRVNWPRLRAAPGLARCFGNVIRNRPPIDLCIQHHPHLDHVLARHAVYANATRRDFLHHLANLRYGGDTFAIGADEAGGAARLAGRRYLTIHNGFDTEFAIGSRRATKCYPHFSEVAREVKAAFPDLLIVQVGTRTSEPIPGADINLIGQTSLREVAAIVSGAVMHVDNEGGLVHLARCLGVRSCVVFGPTPSDYFGYPDNINVDPPFCGGCWWIRPSWMERCPRDFDPPACMSRQDPSTVAARIAEALAVARAPAELITAM